MRYTGDLGCRTRGIPHDFTIVYENSRFKVEVCHLCNKKYKWNKRFLSRIDNINYLKAHVRNYAQKFGATKRVYNRVYKRSNLKISI